MKAVLMYMWKWVKKHFWYMALLCASSLYVVHYRFEIDQLTEFNAQNLIFILWLILLLFPLFSEMEFFGVKLKRELEKSTSEVKESIHDLQIQIMQTQIANTNNQNLVKNHLKLDQPSYPQQSHIHFPLKMIQQELQIIW